MDTSVPQTPAQELESRAWMGTPEGRKYLDLSTQPAPSHTGFQNIMNDKQASFDTLYHAANEAMQLPVLERHAGELKAHRAQIREALSRQSSRETTKSDALRSYLRAHLDRHNALLQSQHLQKLENLKQQALASAKKHK